MTAKRPPALFRPNPERGRVAIPGSYRFRGEFMLSQDSYSIQPRQGRFASLRALHVAILEQAKNDLHLPKPALAEAARLWFSSNEDHLFSFISICDFLKIDPSAVRAALLNNTTQRRTRWRGYQRRKINGKAK